MAKYYALPGKSFPLGATVTPTGVNFALYSKNAQAVELLLFDSRDHSYPTDVIVLDELENKTFQYWHCFVPGLKAGQLYGYRVFGPYDPERGMRFDPHKVLLDPYARAVVNDTYDRDAASELGDNCATAMKSVVIDPADYDWEGDMPLNVPFAKSVIYEMHVRGFTMHPSSGLSNHLRGTYRGLIQKIPYLKSLGITSVELLPVQQFDKYDAPRGKINYWGYAPIAFSAPHNAYSASDDPREVVNEFKDMVKALHRAGIEVILDVVFNHTAEGNEHGPTLSFRGLENVAYYMLDSLELAYYRNYSGTGNTFNANHSVSRRLIMDSLRTWVSEYHIDGFRFDLASVLSRSEAGVPLEDPPILWEIESDPVLASTKIIAEAWDIEQYQLGNFVGDKWAEWNGKYRDEIRKYVKGDPSMIWPLSRRLSGSPDLFQQPRRNPNRSINFITCHDGFTLNDLVSYNEKHNWANGEDNRDGHNANYSWNHGVEGPTDDPYVQQLRERQIKNYLTLLFVSQGTPMLLMGDEIRHTQKGNNNAYAQDNEISWFNWDKVAASASLLRFTQHLIQFNLSTPYFQESLFWNAPELSASRIFWHGIKPFHADWGRHSRSLAFTLKSPDHEYQIQVMTNSYWEPLQFELPDPDHSGNQCWYRIIDTYLGPPEDIVQEDQAPKVDGNYYFVHPRSVVVLQSKYHQPENPNSNELLQTNRRRSLRSFFARSGQ